MFCMDLFKGCIDCGYILYRSLKYMGVSMDT